MYELNDGPYRVVCGPDSVIRNFEFTTNEIIGHEGAEMQNVEITPLRPAEPLVPQA